MIPGVPVGLVGNYYIYGPFRSLSAAFRAKHILLLMWIWGGGRGLPGISLQQETEIEGVGAPSISSS